MVFQKKTGTLIHMTQGANWLSTVEKLFHLAFRLSKRSQISQVTEVSWEFSRHQREAGDKLQKYAFKETFFGDSH